MYYYTLLSLVLESYSKFIYLALKLLSGDLRTMPSITLPLEDSSLKIFSHNLTISDLYLNLR